ncbi:tripartite tricarboxylate transporter substrate binding protein [bacterium]|nr:MAG: tripartite tricarboxylate transporter substrate binding protein [bacterium]
MASAARHARIMRTRHTADSGEWKGAHMRRLHFGILGSAFAVIALLLGMQGSASAADFPNHPVTLIVQYPAGGGIDITSRLLAKYAEKYLGQKIIVVNVVGGGGVVGNTRVASSKPDGYTLGLEIPAIITDKSLLPDVSYTAESFDPIVLVNTDYGVLSAKSGSDFERPFKATEAQAKSHPHTVTIGESGLWTSNDWSLLALKQVYNIPFQRVEFQGGAPALRAVMAGTVNLAFNYPAEIIDYVKAGTVKPIAVAAPKRLTSFPDTPTFKELGLPSAQFALWRILVAPHGISADVQKVLETAFVKALNDPELKADYAKAGLPWGPGSAQQALALIRSDEGTYKTFIEHYKLHPGSTP